MASYKVPQDVEADDKLIGPFSFRQFVYLIIVVMAGFLAWGLYMLFPLLVIVPIPVMVLFGVLALPLRKDQPMEVYLAAVVSYYLKPHKRLWTPDGDDSMIEIITPITTESQLTKTISQDEAEQRIGYLANLADTQGWAIRGVGVPPPVSNSAVNTDIYYEAQQTEDILDDDNTTAQSFDNMIKQSDEQRRQDIVEFMKQTSSSAGQPVTEPPVQTFQDQIPPAQTPQYQAQPGYDQADVVPIAQPEPPTATVPDEPQNLQFNPYPTDMRQSVVQPINSEEPSQPVQKAEPPASTKSPSPAIIRLADNSDLSVQTIAHEARRLNEQEESKEVVISLR